MKLLYRLVVGLLVAVAIALFCVVAWQISRLGKPQPSPFAPSLGLQVMHDGTVICCAPVHESPEGHFDCVDK